MSSVFTDKCCDIPLNRVIALGDTGKVVVDGIAVLRPETQVQFFSEMCFATARQIVWQWGNDEDDFMVDRVYLVIHLDDIEQFLSKLLPAIHTAKGLNHPDFIGLPYVMLFLIVPEKVSERVSTYLKQWIAYIHQTLPRLVFVPLLASTDVVVETRHALLACMDVMPIARGEDTDNFLLWVEEWDDRSSFYSIDFDDYNDQRIAIDISSQAKQGEFEEKLSLLVDNAMKQLLLRWKIIQPFLSLPKPEIEDIKHIFCGFTVIVSGDDVSSNTFAIIVNLLERRLDDSLKMRTHLTSAPLRPPKHRFEGGPTIKIAIKKHNEATCRLQLQGVLHTEQSLAAIKTTRDNGDVSGYSFSYNIIQ